MLDINSSFFLIREQKHSVTKKGEKHTAKCRSGTGCNFQPSSLTQLFSQQSSSSMSLTALATLLVCFLFIPASSSILDTFFGLISSIFCAVPDQERNTEFFPGLLVKNAKWLTSETTVLSQRSMDVMERRECPSRVRKARAFILEPCSNHMRDENTCRKVALVMYP